MLKPLNTTIELVAAGMMMLGMALAQQTPAASTTQPAAGQAAPSSTQTPAPGSAMTAKPKTATTAKKAPATTAKGATTLTLKTQKDKASYALGMNIGSTLKRQGVTAQVDPSIVARGLRDSMGTGKTLLTEDEQKTVLMQLQTEVRQQQQAKAHDEGLTNRKEGDTFLAANKAKEGVVTLPSGLQYKILKEGNGPKPTATDTVSCNYRGTLISGKEFDSSYKRGEPTSFPVSGVIKGWTEALQLMPVGSKWQLFVPADLAYGDRSPSPDIGPGDTLVFEVELLSIGEQKKDEPKK
jgi:FKBP-type peptidyl-prolyl cis-trans isomerase FklB